MYVYRSKENDDYFCLPKPQDICSEPIASVFFLDGQDSESEEFRREMENGEWGGGGLTLRTANTKEQLCAGEPNQIQSQFQKVNTVGEKERAKEVK